jgi:solute carrier family 25 protein 39/40
MMKDAKSQKEQGITPIKRMISAMTGAMITSLVVTPLDVVKIRLQVQVPGTTVTSTRFRGTLDAFIKIVRQEGPFALWNGLSPTMLMIVPSTVLYFTCYDELKLMLERRQLWGNWTPLIAGGAARFVAATVTLPLELVKTQIQSERILDRSQGMWTRLKDLATKEGATALFKGLEPTLLRDVTFSAFYWMGYETVRKRLITAFRLSDEFSSNFLVNFASGALSGTFAAAATMPFDVVKTRKQANSYANTGVPVPMEQSTWSIMKRIVREEGYRGLSVGLAARLARVTPSCAIMISTYELVKHYFWQTRNIMLS